MIPFRPASTQAGIPATFFYIIVIQINVSLAIQVHLAQSGAVSAI